MTTEERLERLERELGRARRRNRWLLAGAAVYLGIAVVGWGSEPAAAPAQPAGAAPKEVRAERFVVVDENGKGRAGLAAGEEGVALGLSDEKGEIRACLIVDKDGAWLRVYDEKGRARAGLGAGEDGPMLTLFDEEKRARAGLIVRKNLAGLTLSDDKAITRAGLIVDTDGPWLRLFDQNGKPIWSAR